MDKPKQAKLTADIIMQMIDEMHIKNGWPLPKRVNKKGAFVTFSPKPKKNK